MDTWSHLRSIYVQPSFVLLYFPRLYVAFSLHLPDCWENCTRLRDVIFVDNGIISSFHLILNLLFHSFEELDFVGFSHCLMHVHGVGISACFVGEQWRLLTCRARSSRIHGLVCKNLAFGFGVALDFRIHYFNEPFRRLFFPP